MKKFLKWIEFEALRARWGLTKFELMQVISPYLKQGALTLPVRYLDSGLNYMEDLESLQFQLPIQKWSVPIDFRPERFVFHIEDIERFEREYSKDIDAVKSNIQNNAPAITEQDN